jgi:2,4-diaminopentanoate dehydrogenase
VNRYRVVQWSTGNVGKRALPAIIDHPELELVGVHAFGPNKIGVDAGELIGRKPIGVTCTDDVESLVALAPDLVTYMPNAMDYNVVARLLRAGINVVTTGDFLTGTHHADELAFLQAAAAEGGATFMGTGFEPGFANLVAGFLTGACRRVYSVKLVETLDCTTYAVAEAWKALGFGQTVEQRVTPIELGPSTIGLGYFETLDLVAGMLSLELETKDAFVEQAVATHDIDLGWIQFPQGTVAGQRRTYRGFARGRPVVELAICWTMSYDGLEPQWNDPEGFRIEIEGEPRVDAVVRYGLPQLDGLSDEFDVMSVLMVGTAMAAVNAIPFVCQAAPGVTRPSELPVFGARHAVV